MAQSSGNSSSSSGSRPSPARTLSKSSVLRRRPNFTRSATFQVSTSNTAADHSGSNQITSVSDRSSGDSRNHAQADQTQATATAAGTGTASTPRLTRLLGSVLGSQVLSSFQTVTMNNDSDVETNDHNNENALVVVVDGAHSTVIHQDTALRPASPVPTMDFSIISPPSPPAFDVDVFASASAGPGRSFFVAPAHGADPYQPYHLHHPHQRHHSDPAAWPSAERTGPAATFRALFPRLWDALASPGKRYRPKNKLDFGFSDFNFHDLPPLDGEEGVFVEDIDDEACFIDVRAVTGIDIISLLPAEVALHLFLFLDLPSILSCLHVSRRWAALAADNAVWRALFQEMRKEGWGVDLDKARGRGWRAGQSAVALEPGGTEGGVGAGGALGIGAAGIGPGGGGGANKISQALEEWGRRRLNSGVSSVVATRSPALSRVSAVSSLRVNPAAPLTLDWRALYKMRLELEKRWVSSEPKAAKISGHADSVYCLEFDSTRIITGSRDRTIRVWSLATGRALGAFHGHAGSVLCLKFERDWDIGEGGRDARRGFMVSGSSDCSVRVWELRTVGRGEGVEAREGEVRAEARAILHGHEGGVLDLRIDDKWIVSCSKDAVIQIWSRSTLLPFRTLRGHEGPVNAVGLQAGRVVSASGDGKMMLWDIESGQRMRVFEGHDRGLACIEFKDDLIVSGSNDCKIKVWRASTGECVHTLVGHDALVRALAVDTAARRLVSASYDKSVKVWDLKSGKMLREFRNVHASHIFDVKFDVCRIVSTSHDQKIAILDFSQGPDCALFV